jgi:CheY-like chemotaxis protein
MAHGGAMIPMSKILIIEDEPDQRRLIQLRLEARGYQVISAGKARDGIALAASEKPALILMDMILPDMHGLDAAIKLKQNEETRATPVIGISAVGSPDFIKTCLQEGLSAYIRKPYDPRELFKTIEKLAGPPAVKPPTMPPPVPARSLSRKLNEIENEFKRPAKARPAEKPAVDDLIKEVLSDLPVPRKRARAEPRPAETKPADSHPPSRILIVDDDAAFVKSVTGPLSARGYAVSQAVDSVRGLQQALENKPDLILLSLILPAGSGDDVVARLHLAPETRAIPVFIMSGLLSVRALEEKVRELEVQGFISKPVEPEDLLFIVESVVGG